jgi:predicted transcriptional regulator
MNVKNLTAGQLMTRELITIEYKASLRDAAQLLAKHQVHCLLVPPTDAAECIGIITTKDIVQVLCDGEQELLDQLLVLDVMTSPSISVQKDFLIGDCVKLMRGSGVRSSPVLDGVKLVGLLSFTDVLKAVAAHEPTSSS